MKKHHYVQILAFTLCFALLLGVAVYMYVIYNPHSMINRESEPAVFTTQEKLDSAKSIQKSNATRQQAEVMMKNVHGGSMTAEEQLEMAKNINGN